MDDGQPVVLSNKMRKALKIKGEMANLETAMQEDRRAAGYSKQEIYNFRADAGDLSDEDSQERRHRKKALKYAKNTGPKSRQQ